jgi:Acyl CoA:acetate/3-ketoacid CoA transferase, alpha subunit
MTEFVSPETMAGMIPSGIKLGLVPDGSGSCPAMIRLLIDRGIRDLHVVCAPIGGMQVDMLIGAGAVAVLETSAVSLGEAGGAPCFGRAVRNGDIRLLDATCPAVFAGLTAAEKGVPFMPIRGIIGSDVLKNRTDWKVTTNPFDDSEKIVVVSAIQPDISLIHAPEADRFGNVRLGRLREVMLLATHRRKPSSPSSAFPRSRYSRTRNWPPPSFRRCTFPPWRNSKTPPGRPASTPNTKWTIARSKIMRAPHAHLKVSKLT